MTTPKDKFEPQEGPLPAIPESEEDPPRGVKCGTTAFRENWDLPEPRQFNRFEPRPATDWLAVLGIGSAVIAFLFWAIPAPVCWDYYGERLCLQEYFSFERLPAIAGFLVLSLILLIARAGNRR